MIVTPKKANEKSRSYAMREMRNNIVQLELEPGAMLSENELATELGISRTPVREALIDLSKVKIVEILPQRGCRVALIDYAMVEEAFFLREVMETAIVELACEMASEEDIIELEENINLQSFYLEKNMPDRILELDNAFHKKLFELCKKKQIYEMIRSFSIHTERFRHMSLVTVKDLKTVSDHRAILEAIKERNAESAKQRMQKHLHRYQVEVDEIRAKYGQYFV